MTLQYQFDQSVLLEQSPTWSRAIAWGIVSISTFTVIWASVTKIEVSIPAPGKLEPQGSVVDIQAPVGGVVKKIHVKNGKQIKSGDTLITLEQATAKAQLKSLQKNRLALREENEFYRRQLSGEVPPNLVLQETAKLKIPTQLVMLTQSRARISSENRLYRTQLNGSTTGIVLTPEQELRLQSRRMDLQSRLADIKLEKAKTEEKLRQNQLQLVNSRQILEINQKIIKDMEPVVREGALPRNMFLNQRRELLKAKADVERLTKEKQQLKLAIAQTQEKVRNTQAISKEDLLSKITTNEKSIASIDSQLTKVILENQQKINEIDSQLSQIKVTLKYQTILSPINGTVFELKPSLPGFVVNSSEPMLKVVPNDNLIAKVFITNKDIGFVQQGQKVDIRIDSFPFHEFGDIKGELIWIGSDALPPDQIHPFYRFPAKVRLNKQILLNNGGKLKLQSGMSVSTNIKLRKRTIISIFTDMVLKKVESFKFFR
ncbi:MAG: HlyD family efflux transporter periplasmic adaptor subunit [Cyanobacteria bacterium P01_A01_bin.84]